MSEGSFGLIPDVAHDIDVFTNWSEHSAEDRVGAVLDVAGAAPIPGGKFVTEGLEHAADAFNAGRHIDDALDAGSAGAHHLPDAPSAPDFDHTQDVSGSLGGADADLGSIPTFALEDATAILHSSEASGGILIERHVGKTFDDLSARLSGWGLARDTRRSLIDPGPWNEADNAALYYYLLDLEEDWPGAESREPDEDDDLIWWRGYPLTQLPGRLSELPANYRYTPPPPDPAWIDPVPPAMEPRRYADPNGPLPPR